MKKYLIILCLIYYNAIFALSNIYIIATGGTIAGVSNTQVSTQYKAGALKIQDLLTSVNGLDKIANIQYEQFLNKDSANITLADWVALAAEVQKKVNEPDVDGIVITHGTDTLEETAYFLNLVLKTNKPVIVVGSMRPATAMSADGPLNLYNAVAVATNEASSNQGVLVAMNGSIYSARDVSKNDTTHVEAFSSNNTGKLGNVYMGHVKYYTKSLTPNTLNTPFFIDNHTTLPDVAIIYQYVGINQDMLDKVLGTKGLQGIVLAGVGDGNIPDYEKQFLLKAKSMGIIIVRSSRINKGSITYNYNNLEKLYNTINSDNLNPQKSRILLMLSLLKTHNIQKIQQYFNTY